MQPFIFHHLKINRIVSCGYILMWSTIIAIFRLVSSSFFIIFSLSFSSYTKRNNNWKCTFSKSDFRCMSLNRGRGCKSIGNIWYNYGLMGKFLLFGFWFYISSRRWFILNCHELKVTIQYWYFRVINNNRVWVIK
jgi:hypothetical protein